MEFTVKEVIELLRKRILIIIIGTLIGVSSFYIFSQYIAKPYYTASVQLFVNPDTADPLANLNELTYAQKVVNTYINFLQTKVFYQRVLEETGLDYSLQQLNEMTEISAVGNTEIFQIQVTAYDREDSYILTEAMQEIAPVMIQEIKEGAKIMVVDPVVMPKSPSGPNVIMNTLIGGSLFFLLAIILIFFWEMLDVNVKNEEELQKKYQLPVLGAVPIYGSGQKNRSLLQRLPGLRRIMKSDMQSENELNLDTKFVITEAYRALRMNLRYTLRKDGCKKVLINSPMPEDGKTTTSAYTAISIAQTGASVLLLDCDLRKGRLHSLFKLKSQPGISEVLSGMRSENEVIQQTRHENLHIITRGAIPPNPTELLGSTQMEELLRKLEKNYDYIIIDSPPVNVVSDALGLIKQVDGVIMVVKEKVTSHPNIGKALAKYQIVEARLLGFVINGVSFSQGSRKKSHYYYYQNEKND